MKPSLIILTLLLSSCASKVVGKNCSNTQDGKFWVCDPVWTAK